MTESTLLKPEEIKLMVAYAKAASEIEWLDATYIETTVRYREDGSREYKLRLGPITSRSASWQACKDKWIRAARELAIDAPSLPMHTM